MKNEGPLMFINTISSEKKDPGSQKVFDSRYNKKIIKNNINNNVEPKMEFLEERKLNYIIEMYNKEKPVLCTVYLENEEITGIPYEIVEGKLKIKIDEKIDKVIHVKSVKKIDIIKF